MMTHMQIRISVSVLGSLATLVASYLARTRGSSEPETSLLRKQALNNFIRRLRSFILDFGWQDGHDQVVENFRNELERLLNPSDPNAKKNRLIFDPKVKIKWGHHHPFSCAQITSSTSVKNFSTWTSQAHTVEVDITLTRRHSSLAAVVMEQLIVADPRGRVKAKVVVLRGMRNKTKMELETKTCTMKTRTKIDYKKDREMRPNELSTQQQVTLFR